MPQMGPARERSKKVLCVGKTDVETAARPSGTFTQEKIIKRKSYVQSSCMLHTSTSSNGRRRIRRQLWMWMCLPAIDAKQRICCFLCTSSYIHASYEYFLLFKVKNQKVSYSSTYILPGTPSSTQGSLLEIRRARVPERGYHTMPHIPTCSKRTRARATYRIYHPYEFVFISYHTYVAAGT